MIPTISQQQMLVDNKLATKKINEEDALVTFKYHRKVMYDRLWDKHGGLMECRGHTYDISTGQLVVAPPRKSFNYGENGWWSDVPLDTPVEMHRKYNGYLACVSWHKGKLIVSTTGTTTSDYAVKAKEYFEEHLKGDFFPNNQFTYFFECCFEWDQHIVKEEYGMKYLGSRLKNKETFFTPASSTFCYTTTLGHALDIAHNDKGEGFMVYLREGDPNRLFPCKLKTPYYVGKKKLMRMSRLTSFSQYHSHLKSILDQRWYSTINELLTMEVNGEINWKELTELERRTTIESISKF